MQMRSIFFLLLSVAIFSCNLAAADSSEKIFNKIKQAAVASNFAELEMEYVRAYQEPDLVKVLPKYLKDQVGLGFTIDAEANPEGLNFLCAILSISDYSSRYRKNLLEILLSSDVKNIKNRKAQLEEALQYARREQQKPSITGASRSIYFQPIIERIDEEQASFLDLDLYRGRYDWDIKIIEKIMGIPLSKKDFRRRLLQKVLYETPKVAWARYQFMLDAIKYVSDLQASTYGDEWEEIKFNLKQIKLATYAVPYWDQFIF